MVKSHFCHWRISESIVSFSRKAEFFEQIKKNTILNLHKKSDWFYKNKIKFSEK